MLKTAKKLFSLGVKAARITKKEIEKEVNSMIKSGVINKKEATELADRMLAEANAERKRFQGFVRAEMKKEMKKAKPLMKEIMRRGRTAAGRAKPKLQKLARKAMSAAKSGAKKAAGAAAKKARKKASKINVKVRSIRKKKR